MGQTILLKSRDAENTLLKVYFDGALRLDLSLDMVNSSSVEMARFNGVGYRPQVGQQTSNRFA